jgi:hypothetical protein
VSERSAEGARGAGWTRRPPAATDENARQKQNENGGRPRRRPRVRPPRLVGGVPPGRDQGVGGIVVSLAKSFTPARVSCRARQGGAFGARGRPRRRPRRGLCGPAAGRPRRGDTPSPSADWDHLCPEANTFHDILHTTFAQAGGRPGRPPTRSRVRPASPPARTDRPAPQTRGPSRRGRGSTPDRSVNASGRRPPASRRPRRPSPGGSHSHSMLTTQRVPERFGTAPGVRLGPRTAGPRSDRPPAQGRRPVIPLQRAGCRPPSTALTRRADCAL